MRRLDFDPDLVNSFIHYGFLDRNCLSTYAHDSGIRVHQVEEFASNVAWMHEGVTYFALSLCIVNNSGTTLQVLGASAEGPWSVPLEILEIPSNGKDQYCRVGDSDFLAGSVLNQRLLGNSQIAGRGCLRGVLLLRMMRPIPDDIHEGQHALVDLGVEFTCGLAAVAPLKVFCDLRGRGNQRSRVIAPRALSTAEEQHPR